MEKLDKETYQVIKRLQAARLRLMKTRPFFALLLFHVRFALDLTCETAYTDGCRIAFNPQFIDDLSDKELEFVLMHEVLHVVLGHPFRSPKNVELDLYDKACDIVVNSNILLACDKKEEAITLKKYGVSMHLAPNGQEGYLYSIEEVYDQFKEMVAEKQNLPASTGKEEQTPEKNGQNFNNGEEAANEEVVERKGKKGKDTEDSDLKEGPNQAVGEPCDSLPQNKKEEKSDKDTMEGSGDCGDGKTKEEKQANQNKNRQTSLGESGQCEKGTSQKGEIGDEGNGADGEEVTSQALEELIASLLQQKKNEDPEEELSELFVAEELPEKEGFLDDHSFWNQTESPSDEEAVWLDRLIRATEILMEESPGGKGRGTVPLLAKRVIEQLTNPVLDWRTILNEFVQEEITDYSFTPPDKRMEDSPFFLPDFNQMDDSVKNILFMIDTSASMSNKEVTECYSEIYGAIQQFDGKLEGKLGFFDAAVVEPTPFTSEEEFKIIRPEGGGGTSFDIIFQYVSRKMQDDPPVSIVILTDGGAPFPPESAANGIPVLWIINNEVVTPPYGKIARILKR